MAVHRKLRNGYALIEVAVAMFLMVVGVMLFAILYPTAHRSARISSQYSQATSVVQHKIDQMRALGYGRLTYDELRAVGVIDAAPAGQPFRFEQVDAVAAQLKAPVGTISLAAAGAKLMRVTVRLEWQPVSDQTRRSSHEVAFLVAQE
jgi:Tfp pilus assembly protein PilV